MQVNVLEFAKKNPNLGSRKLADFFGIGKTQIQVILKNKKRSCAPKPAMKLQITHKKTFVQVLRCESGCVVGLVYNVQKL